MFRKPSLQQVIICDMPTRGDGKVIPIRSLTGVYSTDGNLLAAYDPYLFNVEKIAAVLSEVDMPEVTRAEVIKKLIQQPNNDSPLGNNF